MKELKEFSIPFIGLKIGKHQYEFELDNTFFEHFGYNDFNSANIKAQAIIDKKTTLLDIDLVFKGVVGVYCDLSYEPFEQPISGSYSFVVKFGDEFNDENEDLLILPHGAHEVNIQQYLYESIILSLPSRLVHPGVEDGTLKSEILDKLDELSPQAREDQQEEDIKSDPRWDDLKKLLTDK
jgi:uncharacterized metal-binding protein YceD (DUF177 family)